MVQSLEVATATCLAGDIVGSAQQRVQHEAAQAVAAAAALQTLMAA